MSTNKSIFEGLSIAQLMQEASDRSYPVYGRIDGVWTKISPIGACRTLRTKRELEQVLGWELEQGEPKSKPIGRKRTTCR